MFWLKTNCPLEGSRHLPVLLSWNLRESMVRKWPCQILTGLWGGTTEDRESAVKTSKQEKGRQCCNQDMGKRRDFPWRSSKMSEPRDEMENNANCLWRTDLVFYQEDRGRVMILLLGNCGATDDDLGATSLSAQEILMKREINWDTKLKSFFRGDRHEEIHQDLWQHSQTLLYRKNSSFFHHLEPRCTFSLTPYL